MRTLQEKKSTVLPSFIIKLYGSDVLFPSLTIPPSWHAGQNVHVACHVCRCRVVALPSAPINPLWCEIPSDTFQSTAGVLQRRLPMGATPTSPTHAAIYAHCPSLTHSGLGARQSGGVSSTLSVQAVCVFWNLLCTPSVHLLHGVHAVASAALASVPGGA